MAYESGRHALPVPTHELGYLLGLSENSVLYHELLSGLSATPRSEEEWFSFGIE